MSCRGFVPIVELGRAANGGNRGADADAVSKAEALMRTALPGKLRQSGLLCAPSAEAVNKCAAVAAAPSSGMRDHGNRQSTESRRVRGGCHLVGRALGRLYPGMAVDGF
jgi:hypothetical protein